MNNKNNYLFLYYIEINLANSHSKAFDISNLYENSLTVTMSSTEFSDEEECINAVKNISEEALTKLVDNIPGIDFIKSEYYNPEYFPDKEYSDHVTFLPDELYKIIINDDNQASDIFKITVQVIDNDVPGKVISVKLH